MIEMNYVLIAILITVFILGVLFSRPRPRGYSPRGKTPAQMPPPPPLRPVGRGGPSKKEPKMIQEMMNEPISTHDAGQHCHCVSDHRPKVTHVHRHHILPIAWGGPDTDDNIIWLCQTSHENVHILLREYRKLKDLPPWEFRQQFGGFIRTLAAQGWNRYQESIQ